MSQSTSDDDRRSAGAAPATYTQIDANIDQDSALAVDVWEGNLGWTGRFPEMYKAFYVDCPMGQPILKLLRYEPTRVVVGTAGVGPRRILWKGREIRAGVGAHLCVTQAHRSVKPALLLLRSCVEAAHGHFDVVYGLPRPKGAAIYKLGGIKIGGYLIRRVKILRHENYAARFLPRLLAIPAGRLLDLICRIRDLARHAGKSAAPSAEWADTVDPRMGELWENTDHGDGWTTIRDTETLRWRFDRLPSTKRRYLLLGSAPGATLSAWFACDTNPRDASILTVNDFWSNNGVNAIDPIAIRTLCSAVRDAGFHALELRFTGSEQAQRSWTTEGFVERGRQPLYVRWLNPDVAGDLEGQLHITDIEDDG
ncbi:hypothetical protein ASD22_08605 [Rhodanobacter sp. Root480]|uniref:GNAT family N-acetyltransferase n=1 Tax=Rhodanobacter ginsenosidimutans TaxID=490571 RepID=A0ABW0JSK0_9GAMM|nr:hypothetical protein [Rhodanobacter sp. Root480]KQX97330.1 hypothetical protein ASD22_08605 [Rhodanobacter sp. Root480]